MPLGWLCQLHTSKTTLSSILYYITGHGYGHAVRSKQVIRSLLDLRPDLKIYVRTTAPEWLFDDPTGRISQSYQSIDVGIIQRDSLEMDLAATVEACGAFYTNSDDLINREIKFLRDREVRLVAGDIPPLCFEIAARANIPSVAIGNFTWNWIYRAYISEYPGFLPLIDRLENFYGKATAALSLPYSCNVDVFPRREPIPWVTRVSALTKEQARAKYQLPESAMIVLLSFGGLGLNRLSWGRLEESREFFFIATGESKRQQGNVLNLPDAQRHYEDLLRGVDLIVTKPGYGIVADAIAHRIPILYTDRDEFPEYPFLVRAMNDLATAEFIPQKELLSGNLQPYLQQLLKNNPNWPRVSLDGARVAAGKIVAMLDCY